MAEPASVRLAELLRYPDDLDKIAYLKADLGRKKAVVDSQLRAGVAEQVARTQSGMTAITDAQTTVLQIKEEMMKIDKLCAESQTMIKNFPNINLVSRLHRNFVQVESMKADIEAFDARVDQLAQLLGRDDDDLDNQPNLLAVHYSLTQLRDIRDNALDQLQKAADDSLEQTLRDHFNRLDDVVAWFDEHIGHASLNLLPLVQSGSTSLVVRLAVVIDHEDRADRKAQILQDAQREYKDMATRFKSINNSARQVRGYKDKFLQSIRFYAQQQFEQAGEKFVTEPEKLSKTMAWFFNDLLAVQKGMVNLMPRKWKIFRVYSFQYHALMHEWLIQRINDPDLSPPQMLAITDWTDKYYQKMSKLGWRAQDLTPHVLDNRETELIREYRQLIVKSVDQWMDRMFVADRKAFVERLPESLDTNEMGHFRTKTMGDLWRMLREQLLVATESGRTDVAEGVVDAMFAALKSRQAQWQKMVDEEAAHYRGPVEPEGLNVVQDWLLAIANDQIACIDDTEDHFGYLTRFQRDLEQSVSPQYVITRSTPELETLRDGFVDLSTHCLTTFVSLIFTVDFRTVLPEFFTAKWYNESNMKRITTTFEDYLADYSAILHPSLLDVFVEELADELLIRYLLAVRNRNVKFRRSDAFTERFKDDVLTAFDWLSKSPTFEEIKAKWRAVDYLVRLLETDKSEVVVVYEEFKLEYWDLQTAWVESVLRTRDDCDRALVNAVKAKATETYVERGLDTIMSRVK